jgi:integrase/recombinase XerD
MDAAQPRLPGVVAVRGPVGWDAVVEAHLSGYAGHTAAAYRRDLAHWTAWCARRGLAPLEVRRADVQRYVGELAGAELSPSTISRRLSALAGAYGWAVAEDVLQRSPVAHVRRPYVSQDSQTLGLDQGELERLVGAARAAGTLELALVLVLGGNGLRVSEACAADVRDLASVHGRRVLHIVRKRGKQAVAPLAPATAAAVDAHVAGRRSGPLFITAEGVRLDRYRARRIIIRLARAAELPPGLTAHSLRHTFVTLARQAGVPLEDVQDAAGHADPRTTRRYDRARHALESHPTYALGRLFDGPPDGAAPPLA